MLARPLLSAALVLALTASAAAQDTPEPPKIDFLQYVQAPGKLNIGKEAKVGYAVETLTKAGGQEYRVAIAIVGETDKAWKIETNQVLAYLPQLKGIVLALEVRKSDGRVLKALAGKPGAELREVKIGKSYKSPETPEGKEVELTLKTKASGPHKAKLVEVEGFKSYVGVEGELAGVLLKFEADAGGFELTAMPASKTLALGEKKLAVKVLSFSNDSEFTVTKDPVVAALQPYTENQGLAAMKAGGTEIEVTKIASDAKPTLSWP